MKLITGTNIGQLDARYLKLTSDNDPLTGALTINTNSTNALLVEQDGVKDNVLVVDTTNGRVGVGVAAPTVLLDVQATTAVNAARFTINDGETSLSSMIAVAGFKNDNTTDNTASIFSFQTKTIDGTVRSGARFGAIHTSHANTTNSADFFIETTNAGFSSEKFRMLANGNIGIGITAPTAKLHIVGSTDIIQTIIKANATQTTNLTEWQNSSGTVLSSVTGTGTHYINVSSTTALKVEQGSNNTLVVDTTNGYVKAGDHLHVGAGAVDINRILHLNTTHVPTTTTFLFFINHVNTTTFNTYGINCIVDSTLASGTNSNQIGIRSFTRHSGAGTITNMYGIQGLSSPNGGVVTTAYGMDFLIQSAGAAVTSAIACRLRITNPVAGSNTTNSYGLSLTGWTKHASATVTNTYGIYADTSIDVGTTLKYFIFSLSTSPSLFTGKIQIDSDTLGLELGADQDITLLSAGAGDLTITPTTDTDIVLTFTGTTNSGVLKWMEDEDYFQFDDDVLFNGDAIGFFGTAPVSKATELTDELTTITHTAPGTPDYAIADLVDSSVGANFGFSTKDEGNTVLSVIANLQARVNELETKLVAYGLLTDAD